MIGKAGSIPEEGKKISEDFYLICHDANKQKLKVAVEIDLTDFDSFELQDLSGKFINKGREVKR